MKQASVLWSVWDDEVKGDRPMTRDYWKCFLTELRRKLDAPQRLDGRWVRGRFGVWYEPERRRNA